MSRPRPSNPPAACAPYGSSPYYEFQYRPSLPVGIVFVVLFSLIVLTQAFYTFRYRAWWMLFIVIGAALEVMGWSARLAAYFCAYSGDLNTMQTTTLIMGPAWTQAGVYIALWVLVQIVGPHISPIRPSIYLWSCFAIDMVCLTLQAVGGGLAGSAASNYEDPQTGTTIMVVGIIAQLVCGVVFFLLLCWIYTRGRKEILANRRATLCAFALLFSTAMMDLRGFYRSVELIQGWTGYLISHERFLIGLDAVPMVLAMGMLAILSPGPLLAKQHRLQLRKGAKPEVEDKLRHSSSEESQIA